MDFKCNFCGDFASCATDIISHLRISHKIVENTDRICCVVNNSCTKSYLTFSGLRTHMKKCVQNKQMVCICELQYKLFNGTS